MFEFLQTKLFHKIFSFLIGLFIVLVLRPVCVGDACYEHKTPDSKEIVLSTYQMASKCYTFTPQAVPSSG